MKALEVSNLVFNKNLCNGSTRVMTEREQRVLPTAAVQAAWWDI